MASNDSKSCVICINDFDATDRQTVALPCGHNFCLTCLVHLKASNSPVCPQCRQSFAKFHLQRVSSEISEDMVKHWEKYFKNDKMETQCKEHLLPYVFWNEPFKRLYCNKCVLKLRLQPGNLTLIEDKVDSIKSDITRRTFSHLAKLDAEFSKHQEMMMNSAVALEDVESYRVAFKQLKKEIQTRTSATEKQIILAKKIAKKSHKIQSGRDVRSMVACMDVLAGVESTIKPSLQRQKTPMSVRFHRYPPRSPDQMRYSGLLDLAIDLRDVALSWPGFIALLVFVVVAVFYILHHTIVHHKNSDRY